MDTYRVTTSDGVMVPLEAWSAYLKTPVNVAPDRRVVIGNTPLPVHAVEIDGEPCADVTKLAACAGLQFLIDTTERIVLVGVQLEAAPSGIERRQQERRKSAREIG